MLCGLGDCYFKLERFAKVIELFEESLKSAKEVGDHAVEGSLYLHLGKCYLKLRENENDIDFFNQVLKSGKELSHRAVQGSLYLDLGTHYLKVGKTAKGIEIYEDALKILKEIVDPEVSKEIVDPKALHLHLKCQCSAYLVLVAYYIDFGTQEVKAGSPPKQSLGKNWFEKHLIPL